MQSQPFEILRLLLERVGEVVDRTDLQRRLWPDNTFVDYEHSLNAAIRRLRLMLGDDAVRPRFIETIPRVGYRLLAPHAPAVALVTPALGRRTRLAVLPFSEMGGAARFANGVTEELLVQVGRSIGP